jgi:hypothetical protein
MVQIWVWDLGIGIWELGFGGKKNLGFGIWDLLCGLCDSVISVVPIK